MVLSISKKCYFVYTFGLGYLGDILTVHLFALVCILSPQITTLGTVFEISLTA